MSRGWLCAEHGGQGEKLCEPWNAGWLCDICAREGIDPCGKCGGHARIFGASLMVSVSCEDCDEFVQYVGTGRNIREDWNNGIRGEIED